MAIFSASASTPVASWYADGPLGECANFWGLQRYDVIVRLHQGTAPDGLYTYTDHNGSNTIACSGGICGDGQDGYLAFDAHSDTLSETVPRVYSVTFNGQVFSGSVIKVRMCYDTHTPNNARCVIDAYVTAPTNLTPIDAKAGGDQCAGTAGMARYSVHTMLASLNIVDTPISYAPPRGPAIAFTATYNQMERQQPEIFDYSNLGPKWTFNWLAYVIDDPATQRPSTTVYVPGGGAETYRYDSATQTFAPHPQSHALLVRLSNPDRYERLFPDGSKQVFGRFQGAASYPRKIFMTQWVDPTGESATIDYDTDPQFPLRIKTISDALGFETNLEYNEPNYPYRVSKVTEPTQFGLGRYASFAYATNGRLTSITDTIGIQSIMGYEASTDSINSLTTPYGTTAFARGESGTTRWVEITDPLLGKERVEFRNEAPIGATDPANSVPSGFTNAALNLANTFYWDKKAMQDAPGDYTKARITHWAKNADGSASGIVASEKAPLENRVWYRYEGQSDTNHTGVSASPVEVARVLADGTTQRSQYAYNAFGKTTKAIDPMGRVTSYVYDPTNEIDLTAVFQRNPAGQSTDPDDMTADKIFGSTYWPNGFHQRHIVTDAAGQPTTYTYTASKQLETVTNAKLETTTYGYGDGSPGKPLGYVTSVTSPSSIGGSATTAFTYDGANRVHTVTNLPDDYTVATNYDALDRPTQITYPDGTNEQFQYTDIVRGMTLDLTANKDRLNRWTYRHYNENRQMDSITDPLNRTTSYGWCNCGALESITDPKSQVTTFHRDLQGRVYQKVFDDTSTINYLFEGQSAPNTVGKTSRLASSTDALGRRTNYTYFKDGNVNQVSYTNTSGAPLTPHTPSVNYTYDDYYNRIKRMNDGTGLTEYGYYPISPSSGVNAGRLQTIDGPLNNDVIAFTYDQLGRVLTQSVNGVAETVDYDPLGRLTTTDNALSFGQAPFMRTYEGATPRLENLTYPNGVITKYTYFGNAEDRRLQTLQNGDGERPTVSQFDYTYDDEGQIMSWTRDLGGKTSERWFVYDNARQLLSARNHFDPMSATHANNYGYDSAGNRDFDENVNPNGHFGNGTIHEYTLNNLNQIESMITVDGPLPVSTPPPEWIYDLAGNLLDNREGKTFEWDAANRLIAMNHAGGQRSEFAYDGLGRRVKITEYGPGVTAIIQPSGTEFSAFAAAPFAFPAGNYSILFEGLNNSGGNMMFVDAVTLNNVLMSNGSFETPDVSNSPGSYEYNPANATWSFLGDTGIAHHQSELLQNQGVPDVKQAAFIQNGGSVYQVQSVSAGTYTLRFYGAQWEGNTLDQQVRVNLRPSGAGMSIKRFLWCGTRICEERDASGSTVTKRFYAEGEQRIGGSDAGNYYYSRDHLGSIREVTDGDGRLRARYDYDPYGKSVVVDGDMNVDFGYTGHYFHTPSGLNLTLYRAYDPALGRWLSRDPIGEGGGLNLYGYVDNDPINRIDPLGLDGTTAPAITPPRTGAGPGRFRWPIPTPWAWPVIAGGLGYELGQLDVPEEEWGPNYKVCDVAADSLVEGAARWKHWLLGGLSWLSSAAQGNPYDLRGGPRVDQQKPPRPPIVLVVPGSSSPTPIPVFPFPLPTPRG